eukprot:gene6970-biopygen4555
MPCVEDKTRMLVRNPLVEYSLPRQLAVWGRSAAAQRVTGTGVGNCWNGKLQEWLTHWQCGAFHGNGNLPIALFRACSRSAGNVRCLQGLCFRSPEGSPAPESADLEQEIAEHRRAIHRQVDLWVELYAAQESGGSIAAPLNAITGPALDSMQTVRVCSAKQGASSELALIARARGVLTISCQGTRGADPRSVAHISGAPRAEAAGRPAVPYSFRLSSPIRASNWSFGFLFMLTPGMNAGLGTLSS